MSAAEFRLVTDWRLDAPIGEVWAVLEAVDAWPDWWRAVVRVEVMESGDAKGIGAVWRMTWRTALPYQLAFDMRVTRIDPQSVNVKSIQPVKRARDQNVRDLTPAEIVNRGIPVRMEPLPGIGMLVQR